MVTPTDDHLAEPRERYGLLGIETDNRERLLATMTEFLTHERTVSLRRTAPLPSEVVDDLIAMGPNAFHDAPRPGTALQVTITRRELTVVAGPGEPVLLARRGGNTLGRSAERLAALIAGARLPLQ